MAHQDDIGQIRVLDYADDVLDMRAEMSVAEIYLAGCERLARADAGQRRSIDFMSRLAQPWRQLPPDHIAGPSAMNQDECSHNYPFKLKRLERRVSAARTL